MSKKDYELLAQALRDAFARNDSQMATVALLDATRIIATALACDNPRFNSDRFFKAVQS